MKAFLRIFICCFVLGIVLMLVFNASNFRPLNIEGNDPNSNAMIFGILYIVIGAVTLGGQLNTTRMNPIQQVQYLKEEHGKDINRQNSKFPIALSLIISGLVFIVIYFILNRL